MQNAVIDEHSELFVREFKHDHKDAITLIGYDKRATDFIETPYGGRSDEIRYHVRNIELHWFNVSGFIFKHPHGATITAQFDHPILAHERTLEEDGEEIDSTSFEDHLEKAIIAKLGRISGLREVNLV